jgi:7-carboxy-7-deazaguanine synthase
MSISPKLAGSTPSAALAGAWSTRHERTRYGPQAIGRLINEYDYQMKFVIDTPADCDEVERYLDEFPQIPSDRVWLMPQGVDIEQLERTAAWLAPFCQRNGYHFCPRKHIEWFGLTRGT